LPRSPQAVLEPRKSPVQARSAATVDAILEATIQVLLELGKERLTTTKVALRAGVSIGTLYQYFPNKRSLLKATLEQHLDEITEAVEQACRQNKGKALNQMVEGLVTAFLEAKMRYTKTSVALYSISSDLDGVRGIKRMGARTTAMIVEMLASTSDRLIKDPQVIAAMLQGAMAGVSRRILESDSPWAEYQSLRQELISMAQEYAKTCTH
jgi:AcrR family transcriptional regulator